MEGNIPSEKEILTATQRQNEYVMTSLRTSEGLDINRIDEESRQELKTGLEKYVHRGLVIKTENHYRLTKEGKLLADGIAADLFKLGD